MLQSAKNEGERRGFGPFPTFLADEYPDRDSKFQFVGSTCKQVGRMYFVDRFSEERRFFIEDGVPRFSFDVLPICCTDTVFDISVNLSSPFSGEVNFTFHDGHSVWGPWRDTLDTTGWISITNCQKIKLPNITFNNQYISAKIHPHHEPLFRLYFRNPGTDENDFINTIPIPTLQWSEGFFWGKLRDNIVGTPGKFITSIP